MSNIDDSSGDEDNLVTTGEATVLHEAFSVCSLGRFRLPVSALSSSLDVPDALQAQLVRQQLPQPRMIHTRKHLEQLRESLCRHRVDETHAPLYAIVLPAIAVESSKRERQQFARQKLATLPANAVISPEDASDLHLCVLDGRARVKVLSTESASSDPAWYLPVSILSSDLLDSPEGETCYRWILRHNERHAFAAETNRPRLVDTLSTITHARDASQSYIPPQVPSWTTVMARTATSRAMAMLMLETLSTPSSFVALLSYLRSNRLAALFGGVFRDCSVILWLMVYSTAHVFDRLERAVDSPLGLASAVHLAHRLSRSGLDSAALDSRSGSEIADHLLRGTQDPFSTISAFTRLEHFGPTPSLTLNRELAEPSQCPHRKISAGATMKEVEVWFTALRSKNAVGDCAEQVSVLWQQQPPLVPDLVSMEDLSSANSTARLELIKEFRTRIWMPLASDLERLVCERDDLNGKRTGRFDRIIYALADQQRSAVLLAPTKRHPEAWSERQSDCLRFWDLCRTLWLLRESVYSALADASGLSTVSVPDLPLVANPTSRELVLRQFGDWRDVFWTSGAALELLDALLRDMDFANGPTLGVLLGQLRKEAGVLAVSPRPGAGPGSNCQNPLHGANAAAAAPGPQDTVQRPTAALVEPQPWAATDVESQQAIKVGQSSGGEQPVPTPTADALTGEASEGTNEVVADKNAASPAAGELDAVALAAEKDEQMEARQRRATTVETLTLPVRQDFVPVFAARLPLVVLVARQLSASHHFPPSFNPDAVGSSVAAFFASERPLSPAAYATLPSPAVNPIVLDYVHLLVHIHLDHMLRSASRTSACWVNGLRLVIRTWTRHFGGAPPVFSTAGSNGTVTGSMSRSVDSDGEGVEGVARAGQAGHRADGSESSDSEYERVEEESLVDLRAGSRRRKRARSDH